MSQEDIDSRIDYIQSMLKVLRKEANSKCYDDLPKECGASRNEELEKKVAALKMENARLNDYIRSLERRIRTIVDANVQESFSPRASVCVSRWSNP